MRPTTRIFTLIFSVVGIAAAQQAPISTTFTQVQSSGIVGITAGQTARLNALNLGSALAGITTGCSAQISFLDDQGKVLQSSNITVDAGKSAAVDYTSSASGRQQIRVTLGISHPLQTAPTAGSAVTIPFYFCSLVPTLELMDSPASKTNLVVSDFRYVAAYPMPLAGVMTGSVPPR